MDPSEPLATLDPADRPAAKAEIPAPAAAAWLADPKPPADTLTPNMRYINWLAEQPEFQGPWPNEPDPDEGEAEA